MFIHDHVTERIFNGKTQTVALTCRRTSSAAAHVIASDVCCCWRRASACQCDCLFSS